jgi:uncharacterized protein
MMRALVLFCVILAAVMGGGPALASNDEDRDLVARYANDCAAGRSLGCYNLGIRFRDGKGVKKDKAKTAQLFDRACDLDDAYACNALGVYYYNGDDIAQDYAKAATYFEKACDGGHSGGCFNLGDSYGKGEGVEMNRVMEFALYRQALKFDPQNKQAQQALQQRTVVADQSYNECKHDNGRQCYNLGLMYLSGDGVELDNPGAIRSFRKACDLNFADGCYNLGALIFNGTRGPRQDGDALEILQLYRRTLELDPSHAKARKALSEHGAAQ